MASRERGVTLIEIIIAMVILTVVLLAMGSFAVNFTKTVRQSDARTIAVELCDQRLSEIRASPNYAGLIANFAATENTITGFTGYSRVTQIVHTGGPRPTFPQDFQTVTVSVTAPGITLPIKKTIVVAAP
ncbi:MAG TPA: prepilin-type N-terminal cleavage/methylation domain-containing protein [Gemmatimonadales bacterium]